MKLITTNQRIPWEKYGIIAYLAKAMDGHDAQFGKTSLQKIIYILQEVYQVNVGYKFILYNYGPYSADLATDLEYIAALNGVDVSWVNTGGYRIKPDSDVDTFIEKSKDFLDKHKNDIDKAIETFGNLSAKELELRATIIYFVNDCGIREDSEVTDKIHQLKPYFKEDKIRSTIEELKSLGVIRL